MSLFHPLPRPLAPVAVDTAFLATYQLADQQGFPPSYQAFAREFGWGRLGQLLLLYVPLGDYVDSWLVRSPAIRQALLACYQDADPAADSFLWEPDGYPGLEQALLPFAKSENGQYLAWDTSHRRPDQELPIYVIAARMAGLRYAGATLDEVVARCLHPHEVRRVLGPGYAPLPPTFDPLPTP